MIVRPSIMMKEHVQATINSQFVDTEDYPGTAVDTQDDVLECEVAQKLLVFRTFRKFRTCIEAEDRHLKAFFDELVLLANMSQKKYESHPKIMSQLLLVCYILCGIRNKFIINVKCDLALYLDSTGTGDSTINALAELDTINNYLEKYYETSMVLNVDDYHNIYTNRVPKGNKTSMPTHLATILLNPINATLPIPINFNSTSIHNPNQISENEEETMEALTVHSYNLWLKERINDRFLNNIILIDLIKNNLHFINNYLESLSIIRKVDTMQKYFDLGYIIPLVADWPGQIFVRSAILRFLAYGDKSKISQDELGVNIQPWKINLLLEVTHRSWLRILDNFSHYNYNKALLIFLSDISYWRKINHTILKILKAYLPKFSDAPVELFHSLLRRTTQKHDTIEHSTSGTFY
ncbi:hypothetical protein C2G38_2163429 [Gigaspora rosea]|uniref:Uncharacterized protein n=1 Tax=Gigaspora rosea TaxID=44941 RepID=A0A397VYF2_9GLOM|nr:hypothetical protein C2G38_2163429 [Gigaspora rosea]